jgi:hypothetical protein
MAVEGDRVMINEHGKADQAIIAELRTAISRRDEYLPSRSRGKIVFDFAVGRVRVVPAVA